MDTGILPSRTSPTVGSLLGRRSAQKKEKKIEWHDVLQILWKWLIKVGKIHVYIVQSRTKNRAVFV